MVIIMGLAVATETCPMLIDIRVKFAMSVFHLLATLTNKKTKPKFSVHLH